MKATEFIIRDPQTRSKVIDFISHLSPDRPWTLKVSQYRKRRSLSQNALMWKWLNEVAHMVGQHTGYTSDEMHEFFKMKFLPPAGRKIVEINGETVEKLTSTSLSTAEMSQYMNDIKRWCSTELGLFLPHPEDQHARV